MYPRSNENEIRDTLHKIETCRDSQTEGARKNTKYIKRTEILRKEKGKNQFHINLLTVNLSEQLREQMTNNSIKNYRS